MKTHVGKHSWNTARSTHVDEEETEVPRTVASCPSRHAQTDNSDESLSEDEDGTFSCLVGDPGEEEARDGLDGDRENERRRGLATT